MVKSHSLFGCEHVWLYWVTVIVANSILCQLCLRQAYSTAGHRQRCSRRLLLVSKRSAATPAVPQRKLHQGRTAAQRQGLCCDGHSAAAYCSLHCYTMAGRIIRHHFVRVRPETIGKRLPSAMIASDVLLQLIRDTQYYQPGRLVVCSACAVC
jgi:hypothetical protein